MRLYDKVQRILNAAYNVATHQNTRYRLQDMRFAPGYAEPGYPDVELVVIGDWNTVSEFKEGKWITLDGTMARVANLISSLDGVEIDWCDEYVACDECQRFVRSKPDSYSWTRSYYELPDSRVCQYCIDENEDLQAEILKDLEGRENSALTLDINPEEHGYMLLEEEFVHGFHPGQANDPRVIAKSLWDLGIDRFLFTIDSVGQFDIQFSVYVHEDEIKSLDMEAWEGAKKRSDVDPATMMQRALKDADRKMRELEDSPGITVATVKGDGTADVRKVSHRDFVEGRALDS